MSSGVYVITNTLNGRRYVGSAVKLKVRLSEHRGQLRRGRHHNRHLQSAFDKYGEAAFAFEVLEEGDREFLTSMEQWWMNMLRPEYNILPTSRSGCGYRHTPEALSKISVGNMGKHTQPRTPEWRAKISAGMMGKKTNLGRKHTAEERVKNGVANIGRTPWNKGETTSAEIRAKQSASAKLRWAKSN